MSAPYIESPQNPRFKIWSQLLSSKGVKKHGLVLVSGSQVVKDIAHQQPEKIQTILWQQDRWPDDFPRTSKSWHQLSSALFSQLDILGSRYPLLVIQPPEIPRWQPSEPPTGLELLLPLGDPANLGAALRSALAFGVRKVILLKEASSPFLPKAIKAASSNPYHWPLYQGPSIQDIESPGVVALDTRGESLSQFQWPSDARLLVGEEGPGLQKLSAKGAAVRIPINSQCESLNATVALSIALFHYRHQHPLESS